MLPQENMWFRVILKISCANFRFTPTNHALYLQFLRNSKNAQLMNSFADEKNLLFTKSSLGYSLNALHFPWMQVSPFLNASPSIFRCAVCHPSIRFLSFCVFFNNYIAQLLAPLCSINRFEVLASLLDWELRKLCVFISVQYWRMHYAIHFVSDLLCYWNRTSKHYWLLAQRVTISIRDSFTELCA